MENLLFISTRMFAISRSRLEHLKFLSCYFNVYVITKDSESSNQVAFPSKMLSFYWFKALRCSYRIIDKYNPKHLVVFNSIPIFIFGLALTFKKSKNNNLAVFTGLGRYIFWKGLSMNILKMLFKLVEKSYNYIIVQNREDFNFLVSNSLVSQGKINLIESSGVNIDKFKGNIRGENGFIRVAFIGRWIKEKGINTFLKIVDELKENDRFKFTIAGERNKYEKGINKLLLEQLVNEGALFDEGYITDMEEFLKQIDVLIYPSVYPEGVPRVCLEAAATGAVVFTTNSRGCNITVKDGESGYLFEGQDASDYINKLRHVSEEPGLLMSMSKSARTFIEKNFDIEVINQQYFQVYRKMINS